jgi:DNA-binding beta-propeller fold protein YncE
MKAILLALTCLVAATLISRADDQVHRYLYIATPDGAQMESASGKGILVFDIDAGFKFVRRIDNENFISGIRGMTGCLASHSLYYSTSARRMGRYDLESGNVVWDREFTGGCDRSSAMLDGSRLFAPTGFWEKTDNGGFVVIDGATGNELRRIKVGTGAHNSILSLDGQRLYLGTTTTLTIFDPEDEHVIKTIPDVGESGVFPFTINSAQTRAFVCLGKHVGFDVVDLIAGRPIHRVLAGDEPITHRTHGVALTPDESELWISDQVGKKLFIFDATQMPPKAKGSVELSMGGHGWVNFSLDGSYAWCHTPDVFDAKTKQQIATLRDESGKPVGSSKLIEVHFKNGKVVRMSSEFGVGRAKP